MILEVAEYTVVPGQAAAFMAAMTPALAIIRGAEGCLSAQAIASVEDPHEVTLFIRWRRIEDHLETFRNGPLFPAYRQPLTGLFVGQPRVRHYSVSE
jgi:quinol monooxygenase YgiN